MMNFNVQQAIMAAQNEMRNNPKMQQNQNVMNMMNVLQSGNQQAGEEMANQIIQSLGISKEQAMQQAMQGLRGRGLF